MPLLKPRSTSRSTRSQSHFGTSRATVPEWETLFLDQRGSLQVWEFFTIRCEGKRLTVRACVFQVPMPNPETIVVRKAHHKATRRTILVADDDLVLAQLLCSRLSKAKYSVVVSYDALHAFMAAMRLAPAAVILDINMPGGTGFEVLKRLKASRKTQLIPVIVLSGSADPADVQNVIDMGADEFLVSSDFERLEGALTRLIPAVQ